MTRKTFRALMIVVAAAVAAVAVAALVMDWEREAPGVLEASGQVRGTEVTVSSQLAGIARAVPIHEGQLLKKGELIARIASEELQARLAQAEAQAAAAENQWQSAEAQLNTVISMLVIAALMVGIITTAAGLVREKESGTAEQLMVTPLRRQEIVIAKMAPPLVVGLLALAPSTAIAFAFGVPLRGSLTLFVLASAVALVVCMAIGVFISTFAANLQQALLISFFVLFPVMFLSGTIVPIESMAPALQYISLASPIRYYMDIALAIFLKGVGWTVLWPQFLALFAIGSVLAAWSLARLRKGLYA